jgi:two-component system response regulator RegX3
MRLPTPCSTSVNVITVQAANRGVRPRLSSSSGDDSNPHPGVVRTKGPPPLSTAGSASSGSADSAAAPQPGDHGSSASILVVEDEVSYQEALLAGLTREGYRVDLSSDGVDALRRFGDGRPDLVLLDLLLPGISGLEVCRRMRAIAPVPIIVVSALNSEADIVLALELGAEDYIAKPYRLRELVARIRSVLRRVSPPTHVLPGEFQSEPPGPEVVAVGPFRVDFARRVVTTRGEPVHLSRREFDLLALLLSPPGRVRTREELIDKLWSGRDLADTRTLDTHIRRLRVKMEEAPAHPRYLLTVRGVGFRFEPEAHDRTDAEPV